MILDPIVTTGQQQQPFAIDLSFSPKAIRQESNTIFGLSAEVDRRFVKAKSNRKGADYQSNPSRRHGARARVRDLGRRTRPEWPVPRSRLKTDTSPKREEYTFRLGAWKRTKKNITRNRTTQSLWPVCCSWIGQGEKETLCWNNIRQAASRSVITMENRMLIHATGAPHLLGWLVV